MSAAKRYGLVSALAFAVLAAASVWMGGLNQDEGWYLYAAELVGDGRMPYRDFFFTQGPLMPAIYSLLRFSWHWAGLAGARVATCLLGLSGMILFALTARALVPEKAKGAAFAAVFALLGCNLYHVYYLTIPKTYALASLFVALGTFLAVKALAAGGARSRLALFAASGFVFALAAGVRISMAAIPAAAFVALATDWRRRPLAAVWLAIGTVVGLCVAYGPSLMDPAAFDGLRAAQEYHAARGGRSIVFTVGSISRLVRWYLPLFALCGLAVFGMARGGRDGDGGADGGDDNGFRDVAMRLLTASFIAAVIVHVTAPFPYEDYQVPVMGLLAVLAVVPLMAASAAASPRVGQSFVLLLATGLSFGVSFGSPLLEKWTTNGMDRFWVLRKDKCELAKLREMGRVVNALDPDGTELLTQDLYLAVETGRRVPEGLEMGPFSQLSDEEWQELLLSAPCPVAALSGYSFAIVAPECKERPFEDQMVFWSILGGKYSRAEVVDAFGQGATTLFILRRRPAKGAGTGDGADGNSGKGGGE